MDIKRLLISAAVRILAEKTDIIRNPDATEAFFANLFGTETEHDRVVRELDAVSDKMIEQAKKIAANRKFKKDIAKTIDSL